MSLFDTHCHLNFKAFKKNLKLVIRKAKQSGIETIVVPGTDLKTSKKAIEIASKHRQIYAAVGIHPHHTMDIKNKKETIKQTLLELEKLVLNKKVVAIGEVGIDKHLYRKTKYENYQVDNAFLETQKKIFKYQIKLAVKYNKSLILHNREATKELLKILKTNWNQKLNRRTVFHCCQPDKDLLDFALKHRVYIGVDGDITYNIKKQGFIKKVPLNRIVLETDSPFLLPEPLRKEKKYPNIPANLKIIAEFLSRLLKIDKNRIAKQTVFNSKKLFAL